ncbi:MAG: (Fe-S)-binding protein [candidate division Zixibacteria bacterium]|nr:(Fe-S)-binding protein [candidate division Zixibacteria bacterium]
MTDMTDRKDPLDARIDAIGPEEIRKALQILSEKIDSRAAAYLNTCVHCGLCADSCHYYLSNGEIESVPAYKLNLLLSAFKRYFTFLGRHAPSLGGAKDLDREKLREWIDSLYGRCSLCGRCTINCSVGIDISRLIRIGRSVLASIDLVPPDLQATVNTALEKGNNMGIPRTEWLETVQWLEEELQQEVRNAAARLPIDQKNARYLYTVNPREPKFFPLSLVATAKIFFAARENWTLASDFYDVTNYGLFSGDDAASGLISSRLLETMKRLQAETLVLGECGHGFNSNRWEAPEWLASKQDIPTISILQVIADYIHQGKIKLDPTRNRKTVTLHDPCNLVRMGGVIEEQRFILKHAVANFVEMYPNREKNFCCGGGGGQLSMSRYASRRLKAGGIKAEQIKKTGARIVVAPCHNCIDQLSELNKEYKLGVEIKTLSEIVAAALVI